MGKLSRRPWLLATSWIGTMENVLDEAGVAGHPYAGRRSARRRIPPNSP